VITCEINCESRETVHKMSQRRNNEVVHLGRCDEKVNLNVMVEASRKEWKKRPNNIITAAMSNYASKE
jgi:hypothetical protein